jgi:hypothetical protein
MKYLLVFIFTAVSALASEKDSTICFEKKDVLMLANKIQLLKDSVFYLKDVVKAQDTLIQLQKDRLNFYNYEMKNRNDIIDACEKRSIELEKINEELQPKWYDSKLLWFFNGMATVVGIVLVVK